MKKLIALVSAAAVLVMPMAVCAAPSPSAGAVVAASTQSAQNSAVETAAAEVSMSVGEYTNNAIVSTPGLSAADTLPVGQGGKIIVNGVATNMTVILRKVDAATVKAAKTAATGKILNLVNAKLPVAKGNTVTVNFYRCKWGAKAATIGDNVYIGPGVCCGDSVVIGNNATIGAGSVVTKDIPDDATAVGNYARVINYNNPGRYVKNRWHIN